MAHHLKTLAEIQNVLREIRMLHGTLLGEKILILISEADTARGDKNFLLLASLLSEISGAILKISRSDALRSLAAELYALRTHLLFDHFTLATEDEWLELVAELKLLSSELKGNNDTQKQIMSIIASEQTLQHLLQQDIETKAQEDMVVTLFLSITSGLANLHRLLREHHQERWIVLHDSWKKIRQMLEDILKAVGRKEAVVHITDSRYSADTLWKLTA